MFTSFLCFPLTKVFYWCQQKFVSGTLFRRGRFDRFCDLKNFPVPLLMIYWSVLYLLCAQRSNPCARSQMALHAMLAARILGFWDASLCKIEYVSGRNLNSFSSSFLTFGEGGGKKPFSQDH